MNIEIPNQTIGAIVRGVDLNALDDEQARAITGQLYERKLVVLKGQALNEQQLCDVSRRLGEPVPYLQSNYHHPDYPLIFVSSNVQRNGETFGVARTGGYWHSDTSFLESPVFLTLLYPRIVPLNTRRTTRFIDLELAWKRMPASLKGRLEGRSLIHSGKWKYKIRTADAGLDISEILELIHRHQPPVLHPAVIEHPVTGAKVLYATRGFTIGVAGMGTDDAAALLGEVFDFVEQDEFISEFQWELGDVILWDNRFLAHRAGRLESANDPVHGDIAAEEETLVYRIIMRDGLPLSKSRREQQPEVSCSP